MSYADDQEKALAIVAPLHIVSLRGEEEEEEIDTMNTQMGSALPNEKLDRNNFAFWEYKMHQYLFAANTTARRLQHRQELNNIQQRDMSITTYTLKIKELCGSLSSIRVNIDDDEMVQICLGGLAPRFNAM